MSASTKLARAILDLDAELRKRTSNGSRINVKAHDLSDTLTQTADTTNSALFQLARIPGSGLKSLKAGAYEYRTPIEYPPELQELKKLLRDRQSVLVPTREGVRESVMKWMRDHPGEAQTISDVQEGTGKLRGSCSNALLYLANAGWLRPLTELGRGIYIYDRSSEPSSTDTIFTTPGGYIPAGTLHEGDRIRLHAEGVIPSTQATLTFPLGSEPEKPSRRERREELLAEIDRERGTPTGRLPYPAGSVHEPPLQAIRPTEVARVKAKDKIRVFEEVGQTTSGAIMVRERGVGTVYTLQEL